MTAAGAGTSVALVTGGTRGIGLAIAKRLQRDGLRVIVTSRSSADRGGLPPGIDHAPLDLEDEDSYRDFERALDRVGPIDVLVNNAGIVHEGSATDLTDDVWNRVLHVNLFGTFRLCRLLGREMVHRGAGCIVNISSIAAIVATPPEQHSAYDVSKAGIDQLTRSLAVEWAPFGVRVNGVAPGRTSTSILSAVGRDDPVTLRAWLAQVPQRRLFRPEEIADVVCFLASDDASAITGQTIVVDGGHTIT